MTMGPESDRRKGLESLSNPGLPNPVEFARITPITPKLFIGNSFSILLLKDRPDSDRIHTVVSLDSTLAGVNPDLIGVASIKNHRLIDGPGNDFRIFEKAVQSVLKALDANERVLVQCGAGRSRSVIVCAGALCLRNDLSPSEGIAIIKRHQEVAISEGLTPLLTQLLNR